MPPAADPGRLEPAMVLCTGSVVSVLVACNRTLMRYYWRWDLTCEVVTPGMFMSITMSLGVATSGPPRA